MDRPLSTYLRAVVATYRRRPADLLPAYLLGAAVPVVARAFVFAGLVVAYASLQTTGRLAAARADLQDLGPIPDETSDPAAFEEWFLAASDAFAQLVTPTVIAVLALSVLVAVVATLVMGAATTAGQLAACFARVRSERGLVDAVAGARRYWLSFLGLTLLELVLWVGSGAVVLAVAVAAATAGGSVVAGLVVAGLSLALWLPFVAAVRAVFAFAPVAVVVDDVGVVGSLRASLRFIRRRPLGAVFYYLLALAGLFGVVAVAASFAFIGAQSAGSLLLLFVVVPSLDLLKTLLYGDYRNAVTPPAPHPSTLRGQVGGGLRRGIRELGGFVRRTPGSHALSVAALLVGFAMGWSVAGPYVGTVDTSIAARLSGHVPPVAAMDFFANNWTVALTTAFAGVALAVPALASLWFNGLFFGIIGRLEVDRLELLAFVTPHGIFEIPAIVVGGALGVWLGRAWWRTWRGPASRTDLADAFERAFWVLVGVGVVLFVAAVIEGFVSPYYWRPFL